MSAFEWLMAAAVLCVYGFVIAWVVRWVVRWLLRSLAESRGAGWPSWRDWRDAFAALRHLPDLLAERMDRWVMEQHQPAWTDEPQPAPCRSCRKQEWPCETYMEVAERRAAAGSTQP